MTSVISKITAKNQVTVPKQVRQALGLKEHDQLRWIAKDDGSIEVKKANNNDFWGVVMEQQRRYGSIDTPKPAWGPDVGGEVID